MTNPTWRQALGERYPDIFVRTWRGDASVHGYAFVGDGWRDLVEVLVERIAARAPLGSFRIDRIEEKNGALVLGVQRVEAGLDSDILVAVDEAVALAEATNVKVLHDDACVIGDVAYVGATFWADFDLYGTPDASMLAAAEGLNDYKRVRVNGCSQRLRPHHTLKRHHASRAAIELALLAHRHCRRRVVVTHFPIHPYGGRSRPTFPGATRDPLAPFYQSDCTEMFALGIDVAVSGHTHISLDMTVDGSPETLGTRLIQNPKGYGPWGGAEHWENQDFDPFFTFDI